MNNGLEYWDKKLLTLNYSTYLTFEQSINLENNNNYSEKSVGISLDDFEPDDFLD